jgi:uncharacterized protein (TIGR02145 family)
VKYTVTYNDNGKGSGNAPASSTNTALSTVTVSTNSGNLQKSGFIFEGWNTAADGSGTTYAAGSGTINNISSNIVLYAKWVVKDADGNYYTTVKIGNQIWMVENLKTTKYKDGTTAIPLVSLQGNVWDNNNNPAYCWFDNNSNNKDKYGAIYNWYAVDTKQLAPDGWRVPTKADWQELSTALGGDAVAGGKLKLRGSEWDSPNVVDATTDSHFSALPRTGTIFMGGGFFDGSMGKMWSSTFYSSSMYGDLANSILLQNDNATLSITTSYEVTGGAVRCILGNP